MDLPLIEIASGLAPVMAFMAGGISFLTLLTGKSGHLGPRVRNIALATLFFPAFILAPEFLEGTVSGAAGEIVSETSIPASSIDVLGMFAIVGIQASLVRTQKRIVAFRPDVGFIKDHPPMGQASEMKPMWLHSLPEIAQRHDRVLREWIAARTTGDAELLKLIEVASFHAQDGEATMNYHNAVRQLEDYWDNGLDQRIEEEENDK